MTLAFLNNFGGIGTLIFFILGLIYSVVWVYCLIDIIRSDFKDSNMKIIWILVILFAQLVGPIAYLLMGKSTKISTTNPY
ncbi:PLD nuclease N-terminal domain-containing protein [Algoriphagus sediminis]|uniref:PLD nuclease N-terminal domain-containing protein n=1 Tax=Algoriphagus sediminis TaxID=3057113 RepID=A0ABT7YBM4_9BACT|nr:PLD nuclease N-terminal domain-containing protein [Algoriphagus sediminis]MDN3203930.1 PLD nuclease N-terminal domain-containing protein [Algoriphagus sediminis]